MRIPYISEKRVKQLLKLEELIPLLKKSLKAKKSGKIQMPPKSYLFFNREKGDLRIMPCYLEGRKIAGVKVVNVHNRNPKKFNLPSVNAHLFLYDPENGLPVCYMDATYLTAVRTSAIAAIAAHCLSRRQSKTVGVLGAGVQALHQVEGLLLIRDIKSIKVYSRDPEPVKRFLRHFKNRCSQVSSVATPKEVCEGVDILVTVTPTPNPIVQGAWIREGTHINAIGADAPNKQELHNTLIKKCTIIVDDMTQAAHGGEVNVPLRKGIITKKDIAGEIDSLITGKIKRRNKREVTLFDSTGLAIQDMVAGYLVYTKAKEAGLL